MGVPEDVLEDSVLYLRIIFWGAVPTALYNMALAFRKRWRFCSADAGAGCDLVF